MFLAPPFMLWTPTRRDKRPGPCLGTSWNAIRGARLLVVGDKLDGRTSYSLLRLKTFKGILSYAEARTNSPAPSRGSPRAAFGCRARFFPGSWIQF